MTTSRCYFCQGLLNIFSNCKGCAVKYQIGEVKSYTNIVLIYPSSKTDDWRPYVKVSLMDNSTAYYNDNGSLIAYINRLPTNPGDVKEKLKLYLTFQ